MKWTLLLLILLAPNVWAAENDGAPTARELAAICEYETAPDQFREQLRTSCMSYIRGFFGYHEAMRMLNAAANNGLMVQMFCLPPEGDSLNSLRMRFVLEAKKDKDQTPLPAGFVFIRALMDAFPCATKE